MPFKINDSVKVKEGVMCPDNDSLCISGWQGRIFEIEDVIGIRWDSITLKQLPEEYIKQSEEEGLDWAEMFLNPDEIEPASPRDTEDTVEETLEQMESKYSWVGDDQEGERILEVIGDAEDEEEAWKDHLEKMLSFPFDAEVSEPQDRGPLQSGDQVKVIGIVEADDLYGVLVNVTQGRRRFVFPLCDLTVRDKKTTNYTPVQDYCVWFANR